MPLRVMIGISVLFFSGRRGLCDIYLLDDTVVEADGNV